MRPQWTTRQLSSHGAGEDRLAVWLEGETLVVVVCDGAGGIPGGGRAADLAMAGLIRGLPGDAEALLTALDHHLLDDAFAGESTAVVAVVTGAGVVGASCGDSTALLDGVELTGGQHKKRRLGSGRALPVRFSGSGSRLLVCTDGLSSVVRGEQVAAAMSKRSLQRAAQALTEAARLPSGKLVDDLAFVLVDIGSR
ncbi:MAG: serine/threonine protein phosphatase PrpC [Myxococcota bacterium]|jgi:serine/threonine protein phosphatase PrpC